MSQGDEQTPGPDTPGPTAPGPATPGPATPGPTVVGYAIGVVFLLFIVAGIFLAFRSGEDSGGSAHIASSSGSSNGLSPDGRGATPYPGPGTTGLYEASRKAGCQIRENLREEGRDHLAPDEPVPDYGTVPPTSGDHIDTPLQQADGAWADPAAPVNVVHSLEHGRIAIQYRPSLPVPDQLALKGLYDSAFSASLLFPNPEMPYAVAATAWRNLIGCPEWRGQKTLDAILAFGVAHWGQGPEPTGASPPLSGPDFSDPDFDDPDFSDPAG